MWNLRAAIVRLRTGLGKRQGFYCPSCGLTTRYLTPEGRYGRVFCPACRSPGMAFFSNGRPKLVPCPADGCLLRSWDDGEPDSLARQHEWHAAKPGTAEPDV